MVKRRKTVDPKRVIELASKGLTLKEIAALENISHDTLHRRFGDECEKGRLLRAAMIRAKQVEKALAGNGDTTMLIWLGKRLLGQRDKHEVETNWPELLAIADYRFQDGKPNWEVLINRTGKQPNAQLLRNFLPAETLRAQLGYLGGIQDDLRPAELLAFGPRTRESSSHAL